MKCGAEGWVLMLDGYMCRECYRQRNERMNEPARIRRRLEWDSLFESNINKTAVG